jgi:hypothetical protein
VCLSSHAAAYRLNQLLAAFLLAHLLWLHSSSCCCCHRCHNAPADVHEQILKLASINLCPNVSGQICCTLMMTPPEQGEPSYDLYVQVGGESTLLHAVLLSCVRASGSYWPGQLQSKCCRAFACY